MDDALRELFEGLRVRAKDTGQDFNVLLAWETATGTTISKFHAGSKSAERFRDWGFLSSPPG